MITLLNFISTTASIFRNQPLLTFLTTHPSHHMSIDINWDDIAGDVDFTASIHQFLDDQFKSINLPPYIAQLTVSDFGLGTKPPEITIRHIGDPFPAFYEEEDEDLTGRASSNSPESDDGDSFDSDDDILTIGETINNTTFHVEPPLLPSPSAASTRTSLESVSLLMGKNKSQHLHLHHPHNSMVGLVNGLKATDNPSSPIGSGRESPCTILSRERFTLSKPAKDRDVNDIQFIIEFDYQGDLFIDINVKLLVNYPSANFISLPINLRITDVRIHLIAVLAYLKQLVFFSFLCDINDSITEYFDSLTGATPVNPTFDGGRDRIDIIKKIKIELEIGEVENNVLRNVGKVERFLTDRLRGLLRDEIAWPSWICFDMNEDEEEDEED